MQDDDEKPTTVTRPASAHGWVKRPDIGPGVWELPDGRLYQAENPPVIQTWVGGPLTRLHKSGGA